MKKALFLSLALVAGLSVSAFAANSKLSGTVTVGTLSDYATFCPVVSEDSSETDVMQGLFDNLFRTDNKGNLVASMATVVPTKKNGGISKDDKTFTFHLKKGIKFSDGKPFTAKDVKFTVDAYLNEKIPVPSRDPFDKISKFEIVDDYTIRITLKEIAPAFLLGFAGPGIIPAHKFEGLSGDKLAEALGKGGDFSRHPIGTGPYTLKEWKSGSYVVLEANENYFGDGPFVKQLVFKVVPDTNTMVTQLKTGEIDYAGLQGTYYPQVKDLPGLKVTKDPQAIYLHITFNLKNDILSEKYVRQALAYALPRQNIVDSVLNGVGSVANSSVSPLSWAYNESIDNAYPYNVNKAKQLLKKANWKMGKDGIMEKKGKKLSFTISTNAGNKVREQIEQIAQQYWKQIGVDLKIKNYEWNTLTGDIMENFKFDAIMSAWVTPSDPDPYSLFHSKQIPNAANKKEGQNYAQYVNPAVDKLIEQSKDTTDQDKRKVAIDKIQKILIDDLPLLYVYNYTGVNVRPSNLVNFKPAPFTNGNFWNVNEWKLEKK